MFDPARFGERPETGQNGISLWAMTAEAGAQEAEAVHEAAAGEKDEVDLAAGAAHATKVPTKSPHANTTSSNPRAGGPTTPSRPR